MNTLICPLKTSSDRHGDNFAIISGQQRFTYEQLNQFVNSAKQRLKSLGLKAGDRVAIMERECPAFVIMLFALWRIGVVACLLNYKNPAEILRQQIKELNCRYAVGPLELQLKDEIFSIQWVSLEDMTKLGENTQNDDTWVSLDLDATVLFTSGSSGTAKAVIHSFENHYFSALGSNDNIPLIPNDRWLVSLPFYHVSGLSLIFRTVITGATLVFPPMNSTLTDAVKTEGLTHISLVITQLSRLLKNKESVGFLKNFKCILVGGSGIPSSLLEESYRLKLPVYTTYGLTEMASQVATTATSLKAAPEPLPKARLLKYRELAISQEQEIYVKGRTLFRGYWQNGQLIEPFNEDGWFATGDLGFFDEKKSLTVIGRKDNMFVSGGENIYPEEIENCLLLLPEIEKAIVIPEHNDEYGTSATAFLSFNTLRPPSVEYIKKFLSQKLPRFKLPKKFYYWPETCKEDPSKISRKKFIQLVTHYHSELIRIA